MKTKKILGIILAVCVLLVIAACANDDPPATDDPPAATDNGGDNGVVAENVTLDFWYWDINMQEQYNLMFEYLYNETGISVEQSITPFGDYWTNLATALPAGAGPDIMWMNHPNAVNYVPSDLLLDITDFNLDMSGFVETLYEPFTYQGRLFGVPIFFDTHALAYNKDVFDAAGVAYPPNRGWTWEEMRATAIELTEVVNGEVMVYGLSFWFSNQSGPNNFVWQNGGELLNADRTRFEWNTPANLEALQFWHNLVWVDGVALNPSEMSESNGQGEMFTNNMIGMEIIGLWRVAPYHDVLGDRLGLAHLPRHTHEANTFHNLAYVSSANTSFPDAVRRFMEFQTTSTAGDFVAPVFIPAHSASQHLYFENFADINVSVFTEAMEYARPLPIASINAGPAHTLVSQELARVFMSEVLTADLLQSMDDTVNELLAEAGE